MNNLKYFGPEKCPVVLKLPYIGNKSHIVEKKVKELTRKTYNTVNSRIVFISKPERLGKNSNFIRILNL